jgi:DNA-binding SARP family transcriptional activator
MQVGVLGPVVARRGDRTIDLGAPKQRALLTALALQAGRPIPADRLIDLLWADDRPAAVSASLQTYVAGLRRALEPGRVSRGRSTVLITTPLGYSLHVDDDALDARSFTATIDAVHRRLSRPGTGVPRPPEHLDVAAIGDLRARLHQALSAWRGEPFAELRDHPAVQAERARLTGLRLVAIEDLALVRMALGEDAAVAEELSAWARSNPLRESVWALLGLALVRSGRQSEALEAFRQIKQALADELGVDPGPVLQELETATLQQAAGLWWAPAGASGPEPSTPTTATRPVPPTHTAQPRSTDPGGREWPMVGRAQELAELRGVLNRASSGRVSTAVLVGEPGVGKTRMLQELAVLAEHAGFAVVTGGCSQDEGAPPLWPWSRLLRELDRAVPIDDAGRVDLSAATRLSPGPGRVAARTVAVDPAEADIGQFGLWEAVAHRLVVAAAQRPVLVRIEDLHWADASTLKLLRHLVESITDGRLAIVMTRRALPEPDGSLAGLGETLARHGTLRVPLTGLRPEDIRELVEASTGRPADLQGAVRLGDRTGGNPFFVTELIRSDLAGDEIPAAVADVVLSRLSTLPPSSRDVLRDAAVIGRDFRLTLLAAVGHGAVDATADALEPARAIGVVVEDDVELFRFSHALVRDAVYQALPASGRARRHAELAAAIEQGHAYEAGRGSSEAARHWLAAGPRYAGRAWRAASAAAQEAANLFAWDEAGQLLTAAATAQRSDPEATERARYDLALARADVCRWSGDRTGLDGALMSAIEHAERVRDVDLVAAAAVGTVDGSVWHSRPHGQTHPRLIAALRDALRRLPPADTELRCRVMLALAVELYFGDAPKERDALVEQGLAIARRLSDPGLLVWANTAAHLASWRASTAEDRYLRAVESVEAARQLGDQRQECVTRTILAGVAQETGRVEVMWRQIGLARDLAAVTGLVAPQVSLGWLEIPWLALQGRFDDAQRLFGQTLTLMQRTTMAQQAESPAGAALVLRMAMARVDDAVVAGFEPVAAASPLPMRAHLLMLMLRAGQRDQARQRFAESGVELDHDDWFSLQQQCQAAEAALGLGAADLGAIVYRRLAPYAGRVCCAGAAVALGPVDSYLALAAAAAGERAVAARHAQDAEALCARWQIPLVASWLRTQRATYAF